MLAQVPPQPPPGISAQPPAPGGITGIIVAARPYLVQIQTLGGRYVALKLHNGTLINPLGTTLRPGMRIAVRGEAQNDGSIYTDQIDLRSPLPLGAPPPRGGPRPGRRPGPPRPGGSPPGTRMRIPLDPTGQRTL